MKRKVGAVIAAAGLSSRMQDFKPLLPIGGNTVSGIVLEKLLALKISPIVIVTGFRGEELKKHLGECYINRKKGNDNIETVQKAFFKNDVKAFEHNEIETTIYKPELIFAENPDSETSDMLASIKIGLKDTIEKSDRIIIQPVDMPAISLSTYEKLLTIEKPVVRPAFKGKGGHPVIISKEVVENVLSFDGSNGLKGAIESSGEEAIDIEVDDEGVLLDMDTREEYSSVKAYIKSAR